MPTTKILKLADVSDKFFVREHLNRQRVEELARMYRVGAKVDHMIAGKIAGDPDQTLYKVGGRHRSAALLSLDRDEGEFEIREYATLADMIAAALEDNSNAPLPPTDEDKIHTMRLMLESGVSPTMVRRKLAFIDNKVFRELMAEAERQIEEANMNRARNEVAAERMTITQAAEHFGLDRAKLSRLISGAKGKDVPHRGVGQIDVKLTNRFRGVNTATAKLLTLMLKMFQSGELDDRDVRFLYANLPRHTESLRQITAEAAARHNALPNVKEKVDPNFTGKVGK